MGPVKGEIQPEDRKNDRAIDAPRPHGMHRRPAAPTENSRQVIKKMITAQGRKQKHSARKGNRRFHRGKGHTGCLSNKINPFCSSSCTGRNRHLRAPHRHGRPAPGLNSASPARRPDAGGQFLFFLAVIFYKNSLLTIFRLTKSVRLLARVAKRLTRFRPRLA